jgi:colanic acid/amylovoran biosynthesis glycosyltransferase
VDVVELPPDHSFGDGKRLLSALRQIPTYVARAGDARAVYERCRTDDRTRARSTQHFLRHFPLRALHADIIHFEFLSLGAMYPLARDVLGIPVVVSCRGNDVHTLELRSREDQRAAIDCIERADAVHCVSDEMASSVRRLSGRSVGLHVNRPAVDVERIAARTAWSGGPVRLLSTGRLVWKKGFDYLLTALSTLARRGVEFEARIVGEGELFNVLRFSIEDLGLRDRVRLEGAMTSQQVLEQLQRTDVFVLPSVEEGISNAVLEAMATGVPIVTTNAGGMAEAITDGNEGFVVPVRDVEMLADRIEKLVRDPHLRASMGAIARQRAEREFSIARQVKGFEDIYEAVLGEWNKQAC